MRTLLITTFDYRPRLGGVATCTYELARGLTEHFKVIILAPSFPGDEVFDAQQPFKTIRISLPSSSTKAVFPIARAIRKAYEKYSLDAILCTTWQPSATAAYLNSHLQKIPYFILTHGVEVMETNSNWKKRIRASLSFIKKAVYQKAAHQFAVSHFTAKLVEDNCEIAKENITYIPNGVNPEEWTVRDKDEVLAEKYSLKDNFTLLTVCRLVPHKGIDQSLRAFQLALKKNPKMKYLIAGEGPDLQRLLSITDKLGISDSVHFLGATEQGQMLNLYNTCDSFIMLSREEPSLPAVEGFGITFLEAGACEKPVIAGHSGGTKDAVIDYTTGYLVDPKSPEEAAMHIVNLSNDPQLCKNLGMNARKNIIDHLNWKESAKKFSEKIQSSLESKD